MTDFKDYVNIKNSLKRLSYKGMLDIQKDLVEYHLEFSLMLDGRFYGAEWVDYIESLSIDRLLYPKSDSH